MDNVCDQPCTHSITHTRTHKQNPNSNPNLDLNPNSNPITNPNHTTHPISIPTSSCPHGCRGLAGFDPSCHGAQAGHTLDKLPGTILPDLNHHPQDPFSYTIFKKKSHSILLPDACMGSLQVLLAPLTSHRFVRTCSVGPANVNNCLSASPSWAQGVACVESSGKNVFQLYVS